VPEAKLPQIDVRTGKRLAAKAARRRRGLAEIRDDGVCTGEVLVFGVGVGGGYHRQSAGHGRGKPGERVLDCQTGRARQTQAPQHPVMDIRGHHCKRAFGLLVLGHCVSGQSRRTTSLGGSNDY